MSEPSRHTHPGDGTVPGLHGEPIPTPVLGCPACATVHSIAAGGYIPGNPISMEIDADECIINRHGVCTRTGHPTPTSDGTKPDAFWRCDGKP